VNLHDIVKRKDPLMVVDAGSVEPAARSGDDGYVGAKVAPGTRLRFVDVPHYSALRLGAPLGWRVIEGDAIIEIGHDEIVVESQGGALIRSGGFWNSRSHILPFAVGDGLEVGPGRDPQVAPSATTRVRYLENVEKEEWLARYHLQPSSETDAIWGNYLVGDAQTLEGVEPDSLDFIYSSHVFEHLMNPLGVLTGWSRRLKRGGSVLAVVPDCRYCFDLRQEPSTLIEFDREFAESRWAPGREKYEKWCTGTMIGGDPDSFIRRNYPIHFHYYTPRIFGQMAGKTIELGLFSHFSLWGEPNAKDFAIRLEK
jgi:SAM-dependent methyltransferase